MPWVGLEAVILEVPDHTHFLFSFDKCGTFLICRCIHYFRQILPTSNAMRTPELAIMHGLTVDACSRGLHFRSGSRTSGKGFICMKVWGLGLLILSDFS